MADQQDQSSLGGSVEKASASADASKLRGKSSSTTGYRKRQSTGTVVAALAEKRRRQTDPQTSQISTVTNTHRRSIDSTKTDNKAKGDRKGHGGSVGSLTGLYLFTFLIYQNFHVSIEIEGMKKNKSFSMFFSKFIDIDWRPQQKGQNSSSGVSTTRKNSTKFNQSEQNLTPIDCVASRTRSRTPQNPQSVQGNNNYFDPTLSTIYGSRKSLTGNNNLISIPSSSTNHPSTSRGRGD